MQKSKVSKSPKQKRRRQVNLKDFKVVVSVTPITEQESKERLKHLCKLIFPIVSANSA